jgi:ribosomal protein S18 acetylase RimI-like enzyme
MTEPSTDIAITRATESDLSGIMALQAKNQPERGGTLSANFPEELLTAIMAKTPVIVARRDEEVIGYLVSSTKESNANIPIIAAMLTTYPGEIDAHIYGPICVKAEERGKGIAQAMFSALNKLELGREHLLFIRTDNAASFRAHLKMGMHRIVDFKFYDNDFAVLSTRKRTVE